MYYYLLVLSWSRKGTFSVVHVIYLSVVIYVCLLFMYFLSNWRKLYFCYLWNKHIASLNQNILFLQFVAAFINLCLCLTPLLT